MNRAAFLALVLCACSGHKHASHGPHHSHPAPKPHRGSAPKVHHAPQDAGVTPLDGGEIFTP